MSHSYQDAYQMFETFMGFAPRNEFAIPMWWPDSLSILGRAMDISYRSDKAEGGGDGTEADYIHLHDTPCFLLCEHDPGLMPFGRWLRPPPGDQFAVLGYCLELNFFNPELGGDKKIDFLDLGVLPILAGDPSKGMLVICFESGGDPLIVWGPKLRVEDRGIVG